MLLPQELKKHQFRHSMNGYAAGEVDEYIDFIVSKYEALYRENSELAHKLAIALKSLDELRAREKQVASLEKILTAAAAQAEADAEKKKEEIIRTAVEEADRITAEAEQYVASQEKVFRQLQKDVSALRDTLYAAYSEHIDRVEQLVAISAGESFAKTQEAPAALSEIGEEILPEKEITEAETDAEPEEVVEEAESFEEESEPEYESAPAEPTEEPDEFEEIEQLGITDSFANEELLALPKEAAKKPRPANTDRDLYTVAELTEDELPAQPAPAADEDWLFSLSDTDTYTEEELADTEDPFDLGSEPDRAKYAPSYEISGDELTAAADPAPAEDDELLLKELHDAFVHNFDTTPKDSDGDNGSEDDDIMKALAEAIEEKPPKKADDKSENPFAFLFGDD